MSAISAELCGSAALVPASLTLTPTLACRAVCPIGGMNGLFAKLSMTELRARKGVCGGARNHIPKPHIAMHVCSGSLHVFVLLHGIDPCAAEAKRVAREPHEVLMRERIASAASACTLSQSMPDHTVH